MHARATAQVDNMHAQVFKSIQPSKHQRARMAAFWAQWEQRQRGLDSNMHAARMLHACLPSRIPLSYEFLSHINALVATPPVAACAPGIPSQFPAPVGIMHDYCGGDRGNQRMDDSESCLHYHAANKSCTSMYGNSSPTDWAHQRAHCSGTSGCMTFEMHRHACQAFQGPRETFMGQFPEEIERAERMLREMRFVQEVGRGLLVDMFNTKTFGVLLDLERCMRLFGDHFVSQSMPPDFLQLCQIAATQQNRFKLFVEPVQ
jgi:hypothetical protein